ncbi:MAG: hypothetical protein ACE5QF_02085 [Thermoplasmata archaeon]
MSYLKHIQLSKQLEERAKEATKFRQLAEKELEEAKKEINEAKKVDANIAEAEAAFSEANDAVKSKDYKLALEYATKSKQKAIKAYQDRVGTIVDSSLVLLNLAKDIGADTSSADSLAKSAEEALSKEDFEKAINFAQKSWKKSEKILHEHLSSSFSTAQSMIVAAKNMEKDTSVAEDLLSRARSAVEDHDYQTAMNYMNECMESVSSELSQDINSMLDEARAMIEVSKEIGEDTSKVEGIVERARAELESKDFERSLNSSKQARAEAEKVLHRSVENGTDKVEKAIARAERINADSSKSKALLSEVRESLKDSKYQESVALIKKAMENIENAQFQTVLETISQSRSKFVTARNIGADLSKAMELLNASRESLRKGDYEKALGYARQGDQEVDQLVEEFRSIEREISQIQESFAEAEGLGVDISSAKALLEKAGLALKTRSFGRVAKHIEESKEELEKAQYERTMELIEAAELGLTLGEQIGADLREADIILEECVVLTKSKDYLKAIELATECRDVTDAKIEKHLTMAIENLGKSVDAIGKEAVPARKLLDKAESALAIKDFSKASELTIDARNLLEELFKQKGTGLLQGLEAGIELGSIIGESTVELERRLDSVRRSIQEGKFDELVRVTEDIASEVSKLADASFSFVKEKVVEARKTGVGIEEMRDLLKRAKIAIGTESYSEALGLLAECNRTVEELLETHTETYNAISSSAALVGEARKKKMDVSKALRILLAAKKAFEGHDYEKALDLATRSKREAEKLMVLYSSAEKIATVNERIELAQELGVDIAGMNGVVQEAKDAIKEKKYEAALELAEKSMTGVEELLREGILDVITSTQSLSTESREIGIQTEGVDDDLIEARRLLEEGQYEASAELAIRARDTLSEMRGKLDEAAAKVKEAKTALQEIVGMNVEAPESTKLLERAERSLETGRYEDAIASAEESLSNMKAERDTYITSLINSFIDVIRKAKNEGVNTKSAEELIAKAKNHFRSGEYKEAIEFAMKSESEVERVGLQQDMARKAITTAKKKMDGFPITVQPAEDLLREAQGAFNNGDFPKALELSLKSGDVFHEAVEAYEDAKRSLALAEKMHETLTTIGADSSEVEKMLGEAKSALETGNMATARDVAEQCHEWAIGVCESYLIQMATRASQNIDLAEELGLESSLSRHKVGEAKALIKNRDFETAKDLIESARDEIESSLSQVATQVIENSKSAVQYAKKIGADVSESENLLQSSKEALGEGRFQEALDLAEEAVGKVESTRKLEKQFIDLTYKADSIIGSAKRFGIDIKEAEKLLLKALDTKNEDIKGAIESAKQSLNLANAAIDGFAPSVSAEINIKKANLDEWTDATLTLRNNGKTLASNVTIQMLGDAETEGLETIESIRAGGSETIPLRLKMTAPGTVPLALRVISHRVLDDAEYVEESIAQIEVVETPGKEKKESIIKMVAEKESKCGVCRGTIKKGFPMIVCPCGQEFHDTCAGRVKDCPECGTSLT